MLVNPILELGLYSFLSFQEKQVKQALTERKSLRMQLPFLAKLIPLLHTKAHSSAESLGKREFAFPFLPSLSKG